MTTNIQCYCTLKELNDDAELAGIPTNSLTRFLLPASEYVAKEIGKFMPTLETHKRTGRLTAALFIPPLIRLTGSIVDDETTLGASDYQLMGTLQSDQPWWPNGPYCVLRRVDDVWSNEENGVSVPGAWGWYERTEASGATLASTQGSSAASLTVDDGSKLSPGMVIKIGDEMEFVTDTSTPTNATTLGAAITDASADMITVASGALLKVGETIRVDFEQMLVLEIQTNTIYVERGWNKTRKTTHLINAAVAAYRSFMVTRACNGTTAAEHASATAISRYLVPEDINYLTRQIAMLMLRKAQGGYTGRSGSAESGESFYLYEFPRDAIERIKNNYYIPGTG